MALSAEARAARAKYMREWRRKNPDKQREYAERQWERKAEQAKTEKAAAEQGA